MLEMFTVANEYCLFFEKAANYDTGDILRYFQKIAPLLYLKGSMLPAAEPDDASINERFVTEEQWEEVFNTLREKFGNDDLYHIHDHHQDSVQASLADNMADIYQEMKDFVMQYRKGQLQSQLNAIAQVASMLPNRWGPALLNGLGATHTLLYRNQPPDSPGGADAWFV